MSTSFGQRRGYTAPAILQPHLPIFFRYVLTSGPLPRCSRIQSACFQGSPLLCCVCCSKISQATCLVMSCLHLLKYVYLPWRFQSCLTGPGSHLEWTTSCVTATGAAPAGIDLHQSPLPPWSFPPIKPQTMSGRCENRGHCCLTHILCFHSLAPPSERFQVLVCDAVTGSVPSLLLP